MYFCYHGNGILANFNFQCKKATNGQNYHFHIISFFFFLFPSACEALTEWEYLPPVGPRPPKGFVGLKNAGATCYMNSVIQQLYMIPSIRNSILAVEGTGSDTDDDMFGDEKQDREVSFNYSLFPLLLTSSY